MGKIYWVMEIVDNKWIPRAAAYADRIKAERWIEDTCIDEGKDARKFTIDEIDGVNLNDH